MTPENRNLILAVALSMAVLFGWQILVIQPELEKEQAQQALIANSRWQLPRHRMLMARQQSPAPVM
jgi:hypothetical protein